MDGGSGNRPHDVGENLLSPEQEAGGGTSPEENTVWIWELLKDTRCSLSARCCLHYVVSLNHRNWDKSLSVTLEQRYAEHSLVAGVNIFYRNVVEQNIIKMKY